LRFIRRRQFQIELPFNFSSFGEGALVQFPQSLLISRSFVNENHARDFHLLSHPIECNNVPKEHPDCFVAGRLVAINRKDRFEPTRSIVRQIADRAARQRRKAGPLRKFLFGKVLAEEVDPFLTKDLAPPVSFDDCLRAIGARNHPGICADK